MIRRIALFSLATVFVSSAAALADDMGGEPVPVPAPAPAVVVVEEEPVTAPPPPFVTMESRSIGAGVGISWGDGVISFEGQRHAFSVAGMSLGDLGVAKLISEGAVSNLENLADFEGTYVAVGAGASAGVGASVISMRNQHGVVISLKSDVEGVQLALGPEGLRVTLD